MATITRHGACGQSWRQSGNRTGHCSGCHQNFDGLSAFDRHRRDGKCLDPASLFDKDGESVFLGRSDDIATYWRLPSDLGSALERFGRTEMAAERAADVSVEGSGDSGGADIVNTGLCDRGCGER